MLIHNYPLDGSVTDDTDILALAGFEPVTSTRDKVAMVPSS